jgi:hypothetical protein
VIDYTSNGYFEMFFFVLELVAGSSALCTWCEEGMSAFAFPGDLSAEVRRGNG